VTELRDRVSTAMPQRVAERGRVRRRTRLIGLATALTLVLLAGAAGWLVLWSSAFGARTVDVVGESRLGADEVIARADVPAGRPLARLDTAAIAARVAALAPVLRVSVDRDWPSTVRITVVERTPAAVQARGTGWVLVDRSGVVFDTVDKRPRGLPKVSAPVDEGPAALRATLDVLDALTPAVREQVREVRAAGLEQVTLQLRRGRTVEWGSTDRSDRKAAVLAVLLTRKATVYDVSAPDSPTTRR
jgi:cell division protein FtsQ